MTNFALLQTNIAFCDPEADVYKRQAYLSAKMLKNSFLSGGFLL